MDVAKDYNYDIDSNDDSPEPDGDEPLTLEKLHSAQDCPTPVYIAKACQDTIESKESYVLSLYNNCSCLAHDIEDRFNSLGYTKCIALEGDYSQKAMAARSNPESTWTNRNMMFPGIQHGIRGTHSPSEVTLEHITNMPKDSVKLFMSNIPSRHSQANGSGTGWDDTIELWGWVKLHHKDCQFLICTDLAQCHEPQLNDESQLEKAKSLRGTPHYMNTRDHSYSTGYSLWFTNINLPNDWNVC